MPLPSNNDSLEHSLDTHSDKTRIAVLYGGRSAEHDVSILSATNVLNALAPDRYDVVPVYITRQGKWLLSQVVNGQPQTPETGTELNLLPGGRGRAIGITPEGEMQELPRIDILFPVLHGLPGEDGAVQGLAEVALVALAGCGIAGSANALDKDLAKRLFTQAGIPAARSVTIRPGEAPSFEALAETLGQPLFLKPARQGSSVGVRKVASAADLAAALEEGFKHDNKLLAEEFVLGREIECAVLENPDGSLFVSCTGEIVPATSHGFYTYDAKYIDADGAALIVPANLPRSLEEQIQDTAARAFRALGCDGMARADFFVTPDGSFLVNELNTIPGFTNISMYSKVMAASGVSYPEIIDRLVAHGLSRAQRAW
jgi:D-alanine-D-alanine ligase